MYSCRVIPALFLACAGVLVSHGAPAQPRGAAPAKQKAVRNPEDAMTQLAQLESWLQGLKGHYRLKVTSTRGPDLPCLTYSGPGGPCIEWGSSTKGGGGVFNGSAECYGVGEGPGVRCFFSSELPPYAGLPMVALFGVQTENPGIRVLSVDMRGIAAESVGSLTGNTIKLDTQCPAGHNCERLVQLNARNGGNIIEILFSMGRIPIAPGAPPPSNWLIEMRRYTPTTETHE